MSEMRDFLVLQVGMERAATHENAQLNMLSRPMAELEENGTVWVVVDEEGKEGETVGSKGRDNADTLAMLTTAGKYLDRAICDLQEPASLEGVEKILDSLREHGSAWELHRVLPTLELHPKVKADRDALQALEELCSSNWAVRNVYPEYVVFNDGAMRMGVGAVASETPYIELMFNASGRDYLTDRLKLIKWCRDNRMRLNLGDAIAYARKEQEKALATLTSLETAANSLITEGSDE